MSEQTTEPQQKNNRRKAGIIVGIVALVVAAAAIGAGTYAAFTDTETGPGGTITAGTLDLTVGGTGNTELFSASNIAPGFSQEVTITLNNDGSIPGILTSSMAFTGSDGACTEPERVAENGGDTGTCKTGGNLAEQLTVSVLSSPASSTATQPVPVATFISAGGLPAGGTLTKGTPAVYKLKFALPNVTNNDSNNKVQGDGITITSTFNLDQPPPAP